MTHDPRLSVKVNDCPLTARSHTKITSHNMASPGQSESKKQIETIARAELLYIMLYPRRILGETAWFLETEEWDWPASQRHRWRVWQCRRHDVYRWHLDVQLQSAEAGEEEVRIAQVQLGGHNLQCQLLQIA